jgi:hypothetical protein
MPLPSRSTEVIFSGVVVTPLRILAVADRRSPAKSITVLSAHRSAKTAEASDDRSRRTPAANESQSTVSTYIGRAIQAQLSWPPPAGWDEDRLLAALYPKPRNTTTPRQDGHGPTSRRSNASYAPTPN